jgi:hypothetical protein
LSSLSPAAGSTSEPCRAREFYRGRFTLFLSMENKTILEEKSFESSLKQYGEGKILGILRLCARPASGTRAPLSMTS